MCTFINDIILCYVILYAANELVIHSFIHSTIPCVLFCVTDFPGVIFSIQFASQQTVLIDKYCIAYRSLLPSLRVIDSHTEFRKHLKILQIGILLLIFFETRCIL